MEAISSCDPRARNARNETELRPRLRSKGRDVNQQGITIVSKILSLVALAALAAGCASNSPEAAAEGAAAKDDEQQELNCRYVRTTGSRLGAKECEVVKK